MGRFSDILMDHFTAPRNAGPLEQPDCVGQAGTLGQGPYMLLQLKLKDDVVVDARFQTYGCGVSIAAGSLLTELILGKTIEACLGLTSADLSEAMDGFPPDKAHAPVLAITALHNALSTWPR